MLQELETTYGRLTVIGEPFRKPVGTRGRRETHVECRCSCGTSKTYRLANLKNGISQSCGCLQRERTSKANTAHGHSKGGKTSRTYNSWASMVARCTNPNHQGFTYWGGRGIKVCDRWLGETGFPNFLEDMGEMPEWADSINRKNNDLGYCPENCEWSTTKEQANNKRNNRRLTYNGKTQTVSQWAEETGIPYQTLWSRLKLNWPLEKALTTPVRGNHK